MEVHPIVLKSRAFALRIVKTYKYLQSKKELVLSNQLLRSGTSIGANIAEGQYAQTKADFVSKYSIALKEAAETHYWLELLVESDYLPNTKNVQTLMFDCDELLRMLTTSVKKLKGK